MIVAASIKRQLSRSPPLLCTFFMLQLFLKGNALNESEASSTVVSLSAETFFQRGGKSSADQAAQQCGNQCKLVTSPYEEEPDQLSGPCGCIAQPGTCSAEFTGNIVKELCYRLGNREISTGFTDSSAEDFMTAGSARRLQRLGDLRLVATAACVQASQSLQAVCEVLFEEASRLLLHELRKARSENISFSHCALSFGDEAPLRSERCFTSNQTDSTGAPLYAVGRVVSTGPAGASTPLTFSAHYDNHWDFTTHEVVFVLKSSAAEAGQL